MRSRTSWDVAEEAKENWFPERFAGRSSSASPEMSSGIELVVQEEEPLAGLEPMHEKEGRGGGGGEGGGTAIAFETSRAEALHDLERNSIGNLGLSGSWVPPRRVGPPRREFLGRSVSSIIVCDFGEVAGVEVCYIGAGKGLVVLECFWDDNHSRGLVKE